MDFIFKLHSEMRWLILALAAITLIKLLVSLFGKRALDKTDNILVRTYALALLLQLLLGLMQFVIRWEDYAGDALRHRLEHSFLMIIAIAMAHMSRRWRNSLPPVAVRNTLLMVIGSLLMIILGILILPEARALF
ncbi:MAG: hypothetical protein SGJ05_05790 [bacterium]|nr:hypothetical protein [bacterium]